jgi:hypothetical protein
MPALCQDFRASPVAGESIRFDYSKSHAFPRGFYPYTAPTLAPPRLDNSRRLQNLIADGN